MMAREPILDNGRKRWKVKSNQIYIGVIGDGECSEGVARIAYEVGRRIGEGGAVLVCGGRGGVMEAAARGAKSAGGLTVGILPGVSREEANPYVDIPIVTGMRDARNVIIARSCQVLIAVGGMFGTLSEIALACKFGVPVVGLCTWTIDRPGLTHPPIVEAKDPEEAVEAAFRMIQKERKCP
jgi:uncharacterized protein (TIGR00725 family)